MQQKARMTFHFEPQKPIRREQPSGSSPPNPSYNPNRPSDTHRSGEITPPAEAENIRNPTALPRQSLDEDREEIQALEAMIRRTEARVIPLDAPIGAGIHAAGTETQRPDTLVDALDPQFAKDAGKDYARGGPSWWRVGITAGSAIVTGILFGYLVLTLFTGEPMLPDASEARANAASLDDKLSPAPSGTEQGPVQSTDKDATSTEAASTDRLSQPPLPDYYFLQAGVFQNEAGRDSAVVQLKDLNLPFAVEKDGGYRVYAGTASTREEAESLAAQMPGIEIYIRMLPGLAAPGEALPEGLTAFLNESDKLTQRFMRLSLNGLGDSLPEPIDESELAGLREVHESWTSASAVIEHLGGETKREGLAMIGALQSAFAAIGEYGLSPSRYHLWNVQSSLMEAVLADRRLREAVY